MVFVSRPKLWSRSNLGLKTKTGLILILVSRPWSSSPEQNSGLMETTSSSSEQNSGLVLTPGLEELGLRLILLILAVCSHHMELTSSQRSFLRISNNVLETSQNTLFPTGILCRPLATYYPAPQIQLSDSWCLMYLLTYLVSSIPF